MVYEGHNELSNASASQGCAKPSLIAKARDFQHG